MCQKNLILAIAILILALSALILNLDSFQFTCRSVVFNLTNGIVVFNTWHIVFKLRSSFRAFWDGKRSEIPIIAQFPKYFLLFNKLFL